MDNWSLERIPWRSACGAAVLIGWMGACDAGAPAEDASDRSDAGGMFADDLTTGGQSASNGGSGTPAGGASTAGAGGAPTIGSGGAPSPRECENQTPSLGVELLGAVHVSELGTLFASESTDLLGPNSWNARYGKSPEIVPVAHGEALSVLLQDQASAEAAHVVHIVPHEGGYKVDAAYRVESLGRVLGLALDEAGNYYVATGVDEDAQVNATYPPNEIHRTNIVRVVKFDRSGCVLMESDVDMERGRADAASEILVNPMVAGSARLAYGAGRLALVHSHNTEPDAALDGTRHQKAIATHIDAMTGEVVRTSTMWVSHSFDQRVFFDGGEFVELHLGDAYPRTITAGRYFDAARGVIRDLFHIKGPIGENKTFSRLGGIIPSLDETYGYLVLFSTERTPAISGSAEINGTRDLALVRVRGALAEVSGSSIDEGEGTEVFEVTSGEGSVVNHLRWLTDLGAGRHVERPRIVALPGGDALAFWEEWSVDGGRQTFEGVSALRLSSRGEVLEGPVLLPGARHISRGDDAVAWGGRAVYLGGSTAGLELNFIAADLSSERVVLP